jgi:hypothetical protein
MQPYLFPALAYFHLVAAADTFVFLDDVQFVRSRWTHRNQIEAGGTPLLFTVPLHGRSQNRNLDDIGLGADYPRWRARFVKTLCHSYGKHDGARERIAAIDDLLTPDPDDTIASLSSRTVRWGAGELGLAPAWHHAPTLAIMDGGAAPGEAGASRIRALCRRLDAEQYINMPGGRALYDSADFAREGLELRFVEPGGSSSGLSVIHELLRHGPAEARRRALDFALHE